ncbi:E3 ubiquitin-protein ligase TRIM39-like isoform X2 [Lepisosteus oculatus]|uniref:E3 ubiquitin-protein ligase TRIM39-like isoform X2 n=1 Tax=Lepisosteus oculatus TaxID=7918 RepID=UPI003722C819
MTMAALLSEEALRCLICLDLLADPVSTPCGHNFCAACLGGHWGGTAAPRCPQCGEAFAGPPELAVNTTLKEIAERVRGAGAGAPCDLCAGGQLRAVRSCLTCLASYCKTHLQPHLREPALREHSLADPADFLRRRRCGRHRQLLELFCRTDQACICALCANTDHRRHSVIPLETECTAKETELRKTEAEVQQMIQDRLKKVEEIKQAVELSKASTQREAEDSLQVFSALLRSMERTQAQLIEVFEQKQKMAERRAEGLIKKLEQEIAALQRRSTELEQLSHTEDYLHFLQRFPSLCCPPQAKDWTDTTVHTDHFLGTTRRAVSHLVDVFQGEVQKLSEIELKRMQRYAADVTLDPHTAHPRLALSEDRRRAWLGPGRREAPGGPQSFDRAGCVLGAEGFASGRRYWEVEVGDKTDWDLGVAGESAARKGRIQASPPNGYWFVSLRRQNMYVFRTDPATPLRLAQKPRKVGVYVDYEEGQVSFYNVEARSHMFTFYDTFREKIYPFFSPCTNDGGENSAPLIITPVSPPE